MAIKSKEYGRANLRMVAVNGALCRFVDKDGNPLMDGNQQATLQLNTAITGKDGNTVDPHYTAFGALIHQDIHSMQGAWGEGVRHNLATARAIAVASGAKYFEVDLGVVRFEIVDTVSQVKADTTDADSLATRMGITLPAANGKAKKSSANAAQLADLLKM